MSATLRHDIGVSIASAIRFCGGKDVLDALGATQAFRYAGYHRRKTEVVTFAIKMPDQIGTAWRLILSAIRVACGDSRDSDGTARNGGRLLAQKLIASLGLPDAAPSDDEAGFLAEIAADPEEANNWRAYADWLAEGGNPRGELLHSLFAKQAVKCKYGVPLAARDRVRTIGVMSFSGAVMQAVRNRLVAE